MSGNTIPGMVQPALAVSVILAAQVAQNGTFTIPYPTGFSQSNFTNTEAQGHDITLGMGGASQPYYSGPNADFLLAFGAAAITVTWLNAFTLPSGTIINLSVNGPDSGSPTFNNLTLVGFEFESVSNNLTANAGGGQAGALALTAEVNTITTVATAGDSVKLPASQAGLTLVVINSGSNPMQVFGNGTDTINGVAAATGVSQMQKSVVFYVCSAAGGWTAEGLGGGYNGSYPTVSAVNSLTAHAGGGQASGTLLPAVINRVTTVATANDSLLLPPAAPGLQITVTNAAATNSANVFPNTGDQINSLGSNAAFALAAGKTATFFSTVAGQWHSILSA